MELEMGQVRNTVPVVTGPSGLRGNGYSQWSLAPWGGELMEGKVQ